MRQSMVTHSALRRNECEPVGSLGEVKDSSAAVNLFLGIASVLVSCVRTSETWLMFAARRKRVPSYAK